MTRPKPLASAPPPALDSAAVTPPPAYESSALRPLVAGLFLAAYVILEWLSFIHEYKGVPVTPWNPGLGVVFALMVFGGPRYGAVLFFGVVIAEIAVLRSSLEWWVIVAIAAIIAAVWAAAGIYLGQKFNQSADQQPANAAAAEA